MGSFFSTLYSSFAFFVRPVYSTLLNRVWFERSISECKHIRLKMWMRSLVQENPPTSNRDGVGKNASSFYKWFPIVRPFRRKLL